MPDLAVDFGTSNTVAAIRVGPGQPTRLLDFDGADALPSAVWLDRYRRLLVGQPAQHAAGLDPARYEPNPKRRIDDGQVLLGDTVVAVTDLIAAVLRRVLDQARAELGRPPTRLVLTHPADWHHARRTALRVGLRTAGWTGAVDLLAEPVAAAAFFAARPEVARLTPGRAIAVYDMGGGTTDTAVVTLTAAGWQVVGEAGLTEVGGLDVDQAVLDHVRGTLGVTRPEWADLARPMTPEARRAARVLADDIRAGKETLSSYAQVDIPLPAGLPDAHLTRAELEGLVAPALDRAVAMLASTINTAGLAPGALAGVYLVGGATRMPLVGRLITARVGLLPVAVDRPEHCVALGALLAPVPGQPAAPGFVPAEPYLERTRPISGGLIPARRPVSTPLSTARTPPVPPVARARRAWLILPLAALIVLIGVAVLALVVLR